MNGVAKVAGRVDLQSVTSMTSTVEILDAHVRLLCHPRVCVLSSTTHSFRVKVPRT